MLMMSSMLGSSNASKCCTCDNASHDCCSYLWNNQVFCLECFKEQIRKCSNVETFGALLEQNKHQKGSQKVHTIREQDIQSNVDEYLLKESKLEMNLEQYLKWKKNEAKILKETAKDPDKKTWLERTRLYLLKKEKYTKCIAAAKEDWILSTDGVVNGLCYNPKRCEFEATVKYLDENKVQKEAETMVEHAWVINECGAALANTLIDIAENRYFLQIPFDEKGHVIDC